MPRLPGGYVRTHGASLSAVWQAALVTVLHRYTGQTDLAIGSGAGVLRTDLSDDPSFADVIARCPTGAEALFRIGLPHRTPNGHRRQEVATPCLIIKMGLVDLSVEYPTDLFDADRIERLADHVIAALAGGLAACDSAVSDIDIMPPAERELLLHTWNPRPAPRTPGLLHQVIAGQDPQRVAIRFGETELTYGELEGRSNRLANALRELGIRAGQVVGLLLDPGFDLPVAQVAVMKAGGAWLPLDPQHPPARLGFLAADAAARLVLTTTDLAELAAASAPDPMLASKAGFEACATRSAGVVRNNSTAVWQ